MEDEDNHVYTFTCNCWIQTDQPADDSKPSWLLQHQDCTWNYPIPHCASITRVTCQIGRCDECVEGYHLDGGVCRDERWAISVYIGTEEHSDSLGTIYMDIGGTLSDAPNIRLGNNFAIGEVRQMVYEGALGQLNYIKLYQTGNDGLRLQKVTMQDEYGHLYTFTCNCWIQTDQPADDSKALWHLEYENCSWDDPIPNCATVSRVTCHTGRCDECLKGFHLDEGVCRVDLWTVTVVLDTHSASGSVDTLYMDVEGTVANISALSLGRDFTVGETRRRVYEQRTDLGKINHIRLYQTGEDGIRVKTVVIEDQNGRQYTFTCNCWIQTDQPADDSKPSWLLHSENCYWADPILNCAVVSRVTCQIGQCSKCLAGYHMDNGVCTAEPWTLKLYIDNIDYSGSLDNLYMDVIGTLYNSSEINLGANFIPGETRQLRFDRDFGKVTHIRLYQPGLDGMRVTNVTLYDGHGRQYTFTCNCWIQTDQPADDSKPSWLLSTENCYWKDAIRNCANVARTTCQIGRCIKCMEGYHLDGRVCTGDQWTISVYIATMDNSGSHDALYMDVGSTGSNITEISLGNDFVKGETRQRMYERNFGVINQIRLYQTGDDGIRVRKVTMEDIYGRVYTFVCNCWIQTDQPADDSKASWILQPEMV
ncbi:uncharacterized protein [Argopecten irradians]|uniref:uncharacterized protein n=1 Tax=Argopecten irradians TaxID=31199 RepID=UPI00371D35FF